jgi:branched-chain amino acid transport system permease protein
VLHQGRIVMDGNVDEVVNSELVRAVYAGHSADTPGSMEGHA